MEFSEDLEGVAEACLKAHDAIARSGTPEMLTLIRVLLLQIGQEIAQREAALQDALDRA